MKIVIATHNPSKLKEIREGLEEYADKPIEILSLTDLSVTEESEETGTSFLENALLKAHFYANLTRLPVIADDGGIIIDALDGEPGVRSSRWLGPHSTSTELIDYTLKRLKGVPYDKRTARFETVLVYFDPKTKKEVHESASIEGHIAENAVDAANVQGYPYRKIFIVDSLNKYYAEVTAQEHEKINHRFQAIKKLVKRM